MEDIHLTFPCPPEHYKLFTSKNLSENKIKEIQKPKLKEILVKLDTYRTFGNNFSVNLKNQFLQI